MDGATRAGVKWLGLRAVAKREARESEPCPVCARPATVGFIRAHRMCSRCVRGPRKGADRDLTGVEREAALAEFAVWLDQQPTAWSRATDGLRMFVRVTPRAWWP